MNSDGLFPVLENCVRLPESLRTEGWRSQNSDGVGDLRGAGAVFCRYTDGSLSTTPRRVPVTPLAPPTRHRQAPPTCLPGVVFTERGGPWNTCIFRGACPRRCVCACVPWHRRFCAGCPFKQPFPRKQAQNDVSLTATPPSNFTKLAYITCIVLYKFKITTYSPH